MNSEMPSVRECFAFPLATKQSRHDVLLGGTLLFTLLPGWILNLGHRLDVVYRVSHGEAPYFRGFAPWRHTFRRGLLAFVAIAIGTAGTSIAQSAVACATDSKSNSELETNKTLGQIVNVRLRTITGTMRSPRSPNDFPVVL